MDTILFKDKELTILREAVELAEKKNAKKKIKDPNINNIIMIVEDFLRKKKCVCYGGQAINNILPLQEQFYDKTLEIPDYDFYSKNALEDAKELADIFREKGYDEIEAKAGVHHGTYKVFVNYIPVADITFLEKEFFNSIQKNAIRIYGILYAPPDFLRMNMYLELSRPEGDVSRWEKILKRLILLNKHYPMNSECKLSSFQKDFESIKSDEDTIYHIVKDTLINQSVVFFGAFANTLYSRYMPKNERKKLLEIPDFDVMSDTPERTADILKERLKDEGIKKVRVKKIKGIGEIISEHYQVSVNGEAIVFIYRPLACHSYNSIKINDFIVKIATIDTMLSFYLAFLYINKSYYDKDRLLCMANYLFLVQQKNRLSQKGLLKRFSLSCYGEQETLESIRLKKSEKFKELKDFKNTKEYEEWFLKYTPKDKLNKDIKTIANKKSDNSKKSKTQKTNNTKTIKTKKTKTLKVKKSEKSNDIIGLNNLFNIN